MQIIVNTVFQVLSHLAFRAEFLDKNRVNTIKNSPSIYELGSDFYDVVQPASFPKATLRYRNQRAAATLGLDALTPEEWQTRFFAFQPFSNNIEKPLALRYHGHQFQHYNPDIGDGRGFLFAQFLDSKGKLIDLGTKGSGRTPYSRSGDGRLTLKGAVREILATEYLETLGVPTSKTFSVFETHESLERHDEPSPTRSAVLVRASHSHIRFGTFQRLAHFKETENIKKLIQYCIEHFYPNLQGDMDSSTAVKFLQAVQYQAIQTLAAWMMGGFVHGVLNTDNMNITGESFDYGPYRFLPKYDPNFTAAYFDHGRLYAFGRQPHAVLWNLFQLCLALKESFPTLDPNIVFEEFSDEMGMATHTALLKRLNLQNPEDDPALASEQNQTLLRAFFQWMVEEKTSYEQSFYDLHSKGSSERFNRSPQVKSYASDSFKNLENVLHHFEIADDDLAANSYYKDGNACTLLIDEIEAIWRPISEKDDWSLFEKKVEDIRLRPQF